MLDSARLAAMKQKDMRTALMENSRCYGDRGGNHLPGQKLHLVLNDFPEEFDRIMMMNRNSF